MDDYGGGMSVLWIAIFEVIFIMWVYGVKNFADDLDFMLGTSTWLLMKILWALVPIFLALVVGASLWDFEDPYAENSQGKIFYPDWVRAIGIFLILVVVAQIPVWMVITTLYYLCAPSKRIRDVARPTPEWGPGDRAARKEYITRRARASRPIHGYDNQAVAQYPYYPYPGYQSYHM